MILRCHGKSSNMCFGNQTHYFFFGNYQCIVRFHGFGRAKSILNCRYRWKANYRSRVFSCNY